MGQNESQLNYIQQYKDYAIEQMQKYGIPASITLAQGMLESANGKSYVATSANNHFGIKGENNGQFVLANDDKKNEKFRKYDSPSESYEDHSKFLMENKRYRELFKLDKTDYQGWATGLQSAGYATGKSYANSLISIIEKYGLDKYDDEAISNGRSEHTVPSINYSYPLSADNGKLTVTSRFGNRPDPTNISKNQHHNGIDFRANDEKVLATEDRGVVVAVNNEPNTAGGKSVIIEYKQDDGKVYQCGYYHLSEIQVKVGDTTMAGQIIGQSGNTGTRSTGPHLHFEVKEKEGETFKYVNPEEYLTSLSTKSIQNQITALDSPLLANNNQSNQVQENSPEETFRKLFNQNSIAGTSDLFSSIIELFVALIAMAECAEKDKTVQIKEAATAAVTKKYDLSSICKGYDSVVLSMGQQGQAILDVSKGNDEKKFILTQQEMQRIITIAKSDKDYETKASFISNAITGMALSHQASQNFDLAYQQQQQQNQDNSLQRK